MALKGVAGFLPIHNDFHGRR